MYSHSHHTYLKQFDWEWVNFVTICRMPKLFLFFCLLSFIPYLFIHTNMWLNVNVCFRSNHIHMDEEEKIDSTFKSISKAYLGIAFERKEIYTLLNQSTYLCTVVKNKPTMKRPHQVKGSRTSATNSKRIRLSAHRHYNYMVYILQMMLQNTTTHSQLAHLFGMSTIDRAWVQSQCCSTEREEERSFFSLFGLVSPILQINFEFSCSTHHSIEADIFLDCNIWHWLLVLMSSLFFFVRICIAEEWPMLK